MIQKEDAYIIATEYINNYHNVGNNDGVVILDEKTIEINFGWIFFYESRLWVETKKIRYRMVNNFPIIVDRFDGKVSYFDGENGLDAGIEFYEKNRERRDKQNYCELYDFLACYMRANTGVGDFPSEEAAALYYVKHNKSELIDLTIKQGKSLLKEKEFPWEDITETTEISFTNCEKTKEWLTKVIELIESARS